MERRSLSYLMTSSLHFYDTFFIEEYDKLFEKGRCHLFRRVSLFAYLVECPQFGNLRVEGGSGNRVAVFAQLRNSDGPALGVNSFYEETYLRANQGLLFPNDTYYNNSNGLHGRFRFD